MAANGATDQDPGCIILRRPRRRPPPPHTPAGRTRRTVARAGDSGARAKCKTYTRHNPEPARERVTAVIEGEAAGSTRAPRADVRRPDPRALTLPSLADAAAWLARFTPPYAFGDFFAPEDTVLCALATRAALVHARPAGGGRVAELTAGSAVVLADALLVDGSRRGAATELDDSAVRRARANLAALGLGRRSAVARTGLFSRGLPRWLRAFRPDVVACNPPYIPEPPNAALALVAGAGADGARHPRRAIHAAARAGVPRLVLSWCSLGDPAGVVRTAARAGYTLATLWTALIADGEYSGEVEVYEYARQLPTAFLTQDPATLRALAPDGSARFGYLLLAGEFVRGSARRADTRRAGAPAAVMVDALVRDFARTGVSALEQRADGRPVSIGSGVACHWFAADRWDELRMRALAHGTADAGERGEA